MNAPQNGLLVVVVGGSGVGKDTVLRHAMPLLPEAQLVRRAITRPPDANEDHEPLTEAEFARRDAEGAFAVTWSAHGLRYGVPRDKDSAEGLSIVNGSRRSLRAIEAAFARIAVVEIVADIEVRMHRLLRRGRENEAEIRLRIAREAPIDPRFEPLRIPNETTPNTAARAFAEAVRQRAVP